MMKKLYQWLSVMLLVTLVPLPGFSYEVPRQDSKAKYFYIFGPQGNPLDGKESDTMEFFVDVPQGSTGDVTIEVYDPDTGGQLDAGVSPWNTQTEFSVSGASELDKETFGAEPTYDGKYYRFGPYAASKGEKAGNNHRFTLKVKTLSGDDVNRFNLRISPDSAETFSEKFTFMLLPKSGDKEYFYPEIPAGTKSITIRNFDLDSDGGVSRLRDVESGKIHKVNDSTSGEWADTVVAVNPSATQRFEYKITTTNQINGQAGLQILDDKGSALPIYFRKGAPAPKPAKPAPAPKAAPKPAAPANACNQFTFDARKSFDPEKKNLTYSWDFGDGTSSAEPFVTKTYEKGGAYTVNLTVSDGSGLNCERATTTQKIDVNTPPQAAFTADDLACVGDKVTLDASASDDNTPEKLTYQWNFGDGTTGEGSKVSKTYEKGGVYDVLLNVNDNAGSACSVDSVRKTVRVNTAPTANAGKDIALCLRGSADKFRVGFDGSGSHDNDGDKLNYRWDFGDGSTGEGSQLSHEYSEAGQYTAKLTVNDNSGAGCDAAVDSVNVNLNRAPVAVAGKDQQTCAGSEVSFDASESDVVGSNAEYNWNFGDGETGTGAKVKHAYKQGGAYRVTLNVDDGKGTDCSTSVDSFTVFVNSAPEASLGKVEATCVGNKVAFDASASKDADGDSLKYTWDFGDGTTAEGGSKVSHAYEKGGTYKVSVTVDDHSGGSCSVSQDSVTVKVNAPPVANAGPNLVCCTEDSTPFDGSGSKDPDGDPLSYQWNFGDGQTANEAKVNHAYEKSGTYRVSLVVNDGSGTSCSTSSAQFTANVNSQPVPVIEIKQK